MHKRKRIRRKNRYILHFHVIDSYTPVSSQELQISNTSVSINKMPHYVTTHNANGEAIFSQKVPPSNEPIATAFAPMTILYTTWTSPLDVSTDADIDQYTRDRKEGLGNKICPENGTATAILAIPPGGESPFHRTMTLDVVYVLEGTLELHLDSGEKRVLRAGDSVVQRAGMHKWVNSTENGGWARMLGFTQSVVEPVRVGGREFGTDFQMA